MAGWRRHRTRGAVFGSMKAIAGLGLRPLAGTVELISKASQAGALLCLGKQGLQGRIMRRINPPGTTRRLHNIIDEVRPFMLHNYHIDIRKRCAKRVSLNDYAEPSYVHLVPQLLDGDRSL